MWVLQNEDDSYVGPGWYSVACKADASKWSHDEVITHLQRNPNLRAEQV